MVSKKNYKQANIDWLAEKSKEEGVKSLGRGIYYKVLKESETKDIHPTPRSIVTVHYTGWTINGKKFDTSKSGVPLAMRLSDLIDGWIYSLQKMYIGYKWLIFIPAEFGYGKYAQQGIPAHSTLIFSTVLKKCVSTYFSYLCIWKY